MTPWAQAAQHFWNGSIVTPVMCAFFFGFTPCDLTARWLSGSHVEFLGASAQLLSVLKCIGVSGIPSFQTAICVYTWVPVKLSPDDRIAEQDWQEPIRRMHTGACCRVYCRSFSFQYFRKCEDTLFLIYVFCAFDRIWNHSTESRKRQKEKYHL